MVFELEQQQRGGISTKEKSPHNRRLRKETMRNHPSVCWSDAHANHKVKASLLKVSPKLIFLSVTHSGKVLINRLSISPIPSLKYENKVTLPKHGLAGCVKSKDQVIPKQSWLITRQLSETDTSSQERFGLNNFPTPPCPLWFFHYETR